MLKRLALLAVFGALATVGLLEGQTAPLSAPKQGIAKPGSSQDGKGDTQPHGGNQATPNLVPPPANQPSAPTCDEACQRDRENLDIQRKLEWFTGILAIVGVLQFGGMIWQAILLRQTRSDIHTQADTMKTQAQDARDAAVGSAQMAQATLDTIKRQADSMERQIALQEAVSRQWLEVSGWRREGEGSREEIPPKFSVAAEIINPTNMPLTIDAMNFTVRTTKETFGGGNELAPGQPIKIAFPIVVESDSDLAAYKSYRFLLTFYGSIEYTDAFGKKQVQPFSCTGVFGPDRYARFSLVPIPRMV